MILAWDTGSLGTCLWALIDDTSTGRDRRRTAWTPSLVNKTHPLVSVHLFSFHHGQMHCAIWVTILLCLIFVRTLSFLGPKLWWQGPCSSHNGQSGSSSMWQVRVLALQSLPGSLRMWACLGPLFLYLSLIWCHGHYRGPET